MFVCNTLSSSSFQEIPFDKNRQSEHSAKEAKGKYDLPAAVLIKTVSFPYGFEPFLVEFLRCGD